MDFSASHSVVILGAGPGGIQLAYYLQQASIDYVIVERTNTAGSFYSVYPRRRDLISFNRVNTLFEDPKIKLRFDWNSLLTDDYSFPFANFSRKLYPKADDLVKYLNAFVDHFKLNIRYQSNVSRIIRSETGGYSLNFSDHDDKLSCDKLVVASGFTNPYIPSIPGIELCTNYKDVSVSPDFFENKRILVVGKGNSAFEIADIALENCSLLHIASPNPITLAWKSRHPGHVRANHTRLLDSYQLKLLNGTLDCNILSISKNPKGELVVIVSYIHADGETEELIYDEVINCAGFSFDTSIFDDSCKPDTVLNGKLPAITPYWESVNNNNMFFAGTLMQTRDFKKSSSAFIGGFRYNVRTLSKKLVSDLNATKYPSIISGKESAKDLSDRILYRCNTTSGLWAQFKYLCDVIIIQESSFSWYEELPLQSLHEGSFSEQELYIVLTFEWGEWPGDVMSIERHPTADKAYTNVFLHPILRLYSQECLLHTHHILEDLFGNYSSEAERGNVISRGNFDIKTYHDKQHLVPLIQFIDSKVLSRGNTVHAKSSDDCVFNDNLAWDG